MIYIKNATEMSCIRRAKSKMLPNIYIQQIAKQRL